MNNQAAQTMPELPEPWTIRYHDDATGREIGPPTPLYTADQMHQYARDYAAMLAAAPAASAKYCSDERPCTPCFSNNGPCEDAPAASGVDTSTNEAWVERAQEKIAAMEAASGGEDDMCPNCVTPWKCNGPHESTGGASVSERARELGERWRGCAKSAANGPMFDGASEYAVAGTYIACADELESLISGGSHA